MVDIIFVYSMGRRSLDFLTNVLYFHIGLVERFFTIIVLLLSSTKYMDEDYYNIIKTHRMMRHRCDDRGYTHKHTLYLY